MPASFASTHLESDQSRFGNPFRFIQIGIRSSVLSFYQPLTSSRYLHRMDDVKPDIWSDWLLHRRIAGDRESDCTLRANVERYADRVLEGAQLAPGMTLLDVGAGEGLVAFRAIARTGPSLRVILADISAFMLQSRQNMRQRKRYSGAM